MRKFIYYNWNFGINGQPTLAAQYYNYMRGYWKNGQRMAYGGDGLTPAIRGQFGNCSGLYVSW